MIMLFGVNNELFYYDDWPPIRRHIVPGTFGTGSVAEWIVMSAPLASHSGKQRNVRVHLARAKWPLNSENRLTVKYGRYYGDNKIFGS